MYYFGRSMPKFFVKTYGCQMNERDSEQVAHSLIARGYKRVADYVEELVAKKTTRATGITDRGYSRMDDPRYSIVDVAEEAGSQSTICDQQLAPRQGTAFVSIM